MVEENKVLFSEPVRHYLDYCSCFFKELASEVPSYVSVTETSGTPEENDAQLENKILFYAVGHGQACIFTVEDLADYIIKQSGSHSRCTYNLRLDNFKDKIVHLLSCITGQELGPELNNHDIGAYIGYDEAFTFGIFKEGVTWPNPCEPPDELYDFYSFVDCDVEGERAMILNGKNVGDAIDAIKSKFDEYIAKYTTGEWKERWIAPQAVRWLEHDKAHLVPLGDMAMVPCPVPATPTPTPTPTPAPTPTLLPPKLGACIFPRMFMGTLTPRRDQIIPFIRIKCLQDKWGIY